MLFNSFAFLFGFLPVVFVGFLLLARRSHLAAAAWLTLASLFFYGWWNPVYVPLLLGSIVGNFLLAEAIAKSGEPRRKRLLVIAIVANLALLGYYKYAGFLVGTAVELGADLTIPAIVLPLGISFFTFTQIAFLVDTYQHKAREPRFVHYTLFVTYFPHLIAGPVLHHKEMMPQFSQPETYRLSAENIAVGLTIFAIGLFKKVVLADNVAVYATPVFDAAAAGETLSLLEAWGGALAYAMQLYFDFSGYSDMAIGASRLFGITLPLNFNSPYQAVNIIDFWRRWHMTLSRFLRDYLYVPLGGNRKGKARRYLNLFITMVLGGMWHGAGWTFIAWGALHGLYLMINHAWHGLRERMGWTGSGTRLGRACAITVTFLAVLIGWVFFRAATFEAALEVLAGMIGLNGTVVPAGWASLVPGSVAGLLQELSVRFGDSGLFEGKAQLLWLGITLAIAFFMPNTQHIMRHYRPALDAPGPGEEGRSRLTWQPTVAWASAAAILALIAVANFGQVSEFLYFQF